MRMEEIKQRFHGVVVVEHPGMQDPLSPGKHYRRMMAASGYTKREMKEKVMVRLGIREGDGYSVKVM